MSDNDQKKVIENISYLAAAMQYRKKDHETLTPPRAKKKPFDPQGMFQQMKARWEAKEAIFVVPDKYEVLEPVAPPKNYPLHQKCGHPLNGEIHYRRSNDMERTDTLAGYGLKSKLIKCPHCTEENERLRRIRLSAKDLNNLFADADVPDYARKWTFENFPGDTLDGFAAETIQGITEDSINLLKNGDAGISLYIYGAPGAGKTSVAKSALHRYMQEGYACQFLAVRKYIRLLQSTMHNKETTPETQRMKHLEELVLTVPVLVFDDLGSENPSDWVLGKIFDVIEERGANGLITIITSNNDLRALNKFWHKVQDVDVQQQSGRIIRRISQRFRVVPMAGGGEDEGFE